MCSLCKIFPFPFCVKVGDNVCVFVPFDNPFDALSPFDIQRVCNCWTAACLRERCLSYIRNYYEGPWNMDPVNTYMYMYISLAALDYR